jgi:transcriptional/translational regulatory protein YebC/TACO1
MIDCLSDDPRGLGAAVRRVFAEHGGQAGAAGCVSYLFNSVGLMAYPPGTDARRLARAALAAGAEDVVTNDDTSVEVLTDPPDFTAVSSRLSEQGLAPVVAEITWRAASTLELSGEAAGEMLRLLGALESLGSGCEVYSNAEIAARELNES